jgi:hypothetical protein
LKQGGLFDVAEPVARGAVQDGADAVGGALPAAPGQALGDAQAQLEDGEQVREDGQEGGEPEDTGSIRWYAEVQKRLWEEGVKSASAYWAKRGVRWP